MSTAGWTQIGMKKDSGSLTSRKDGLLQFSFSVPRRTSQRTWTDCETPLTMDCIYDLKVFSIEKQGFSEEKLTVGTQLPWKETWTLSHSKIWMPVSTSSEIKVLWSGEASTELVIAIDWTIGEVCMRRRRTMVESKTGGCLFLLVCCLDFYCYYILT